MKFEKTINYIIIIRFFGLDFLNVIKEFKLFLIKKGNKIATLFLKRNLKYFRILIAYD